MSIQWVKLLRSTASGLAVIWSLTSVAQNPTRYLITNDDNSQGNTATFYAIGVGGALTHTAFIHTGGTGRDGLGAVVTNKINVLHDINGDCAFLSERISINSGTPDVAAISVSRRKLVGQFAASPVDQVQTSGMGLASNTSYVFAEFSYSQTLGAYKRSPQCQLQYLGSVPASGLGGGPIINMKAHQNILVVAFFDGSIESFNVSSGIPVPNGDLHYSTAYTQLGKSPSALDISSDGHYAIFGDAGDTVEVSNLSSGKLTAPVIYSPVGTGSIVGGLALSPDETLLYLTDFSNGRVNAAFFDKTTGGVTAGCTSPTLKGFNHLFSFLASVLPTFPSGTGNLLYTADPDKRISALRVSESGNTCSLAGSPKEPTLDLQTDTLESIGVFPPRTF